MQKPCVVFVDDEIETLKPLADCVRDAGIAGCTVESPADIDTEMLVAADLVVVDYTLEKWPSMVDEDEISRKPLNGIALSAVLREHSRANGTEAPTAFALITGKPNSVSSIPGERRPHVVARLSNLEWFFEKQASTEDNVRRIASLASAVHNLPRNLNEGPIDVGELLEILGAGAADLSDRYREAIERCRPPIHHLSEHSGGLAVIRWLLHRIIPHTCFLVDSLNLAARLRVTSESLLAQLQAETEFSKQLSVYRYGGPLNDFGGDRWWRGGIEQWIWELTEGNSANAEAVLAELRKLGADLLEPVGIVRPVLTLGENLEVEATFSARDDVEPVQLDDWPSYAEPAYMRKLLLSEHEELGIFKSDQTG
ncbi:MAG: hypothetical protein AAGD07_22445 [Planctomycetota bacterium]